MTKVTINVFDQDVVSVNGNTPESTVVTSRRWNGYFNIGTDANLDEYYFTRYFPKSGTYRFKLGHRVGNLDGILEMGVNKSEDTTNNTNIFSGLDLYASPQVNLSESFATVKVARGFNNINFKINGKNASSSKYDLYWYICEFDLIDEHPVLGAEGVRKSSGVSWEEIGRKKIHQAEASINVKIPEKRLLRVEVSGIKSGNLLLYLRFNGDATGTDTSSGNYSQRLNVNGGTDDTTGEQNRTQISLSSGSDAQTFSEFEIVNILDEEKIVIIHTLMRGASAGSGSSPDRMEYVGKWDVVTSLINEINIVASSTTFASGSEVVIYGHD